METLPSRGVRYLTSHNVRYLVYISVPIPAPEDKKKLPLVTWRSYLQTYITDHNSSLGRITISASVDLKLKIDMESKQQIFENISW